MSHQKNFQCFTENVQEALLSPFMSLSLWCLKNIYLFLPLCSDPCLLLSCGFWMVALIRSFQFTSQEVSLSPLSLPQLWPLISFHHSHSSKQFLLIPLVITKSHVLSPYLPPLAHEEGAVLVATEVSWPLHLSDAWDNKHHCLLLIDGYQGHPGHNFMVPQCQSHHSLDKCNESPAGHSPSRHLPHQWNTDIKNYLVPHIEHCSSVLHAGH